MPGMSTGLEANDPTVVSAFHSALVTQGLIVIALILLVGGGGSCCAYAISGTRPRPGPMHRRARPRRVPRARRPAAAADRLRR